MLPPPHLAASAAFGPGNSASTSPFALAGAATNGFDRGLTDNGGLLGQGQGAYGRGGATQAHQLYDSASHMHAAKDDPRIRNVWQHNLKQEMANLRELVDTYPYIAMVAKPSPEDCVPGTYYSFQDTEFPGIVGRPIGSFTSKADYHYQTLRVNVDLLKMIQLGITLFKTDGSLPSNDPDKPYQQQNMISAPCTWQFNFQFSLENDMYASDSTAMLSKAGLDFDRHATHGIDPNKFAALLISSGLVMFSDVKWISFHSGYDFGYLMKMMMNKELPPDETQFHALLEKYFPSLLDIKYIVKYVGSRGSINDNQSLTAEASQIIQNISQKSGLQDLANELGIQRIGIQHQAGSDSLLTGQVYFKMREKIFNGEIDEDRYIGQIWGLNGQMPMAPNIQGSTGQNMNGAASIFYSGGSGAVSNAAAPSTPQTGHIGLVGQNQTPVPPQSSHGGAGSFGLSTPGGFGNFQYKTAMS